MADISRFSVPDVGDVGDVGDVAPNIRAHGFDEEDIWDATSIAAFFALSSRLTNVSRMRPNDEYYPMGRVPKSK